MASHASAASAASASISTNARTPSALPAPQTSPVRLASLPLELLVQIVGQLDLRELVQLASTCKWIFHQVGARQGLASHDLG